MTADQRQITRSRKWKLLLVILVAVYSVAPAAAESNSRNEDSETTLEELLESKVTHETGLSGVYMATTSSAVVVTREMIQRYGWRSLSEILDHMRGLHVIQAPWNSFLQGRDLSGTNDLSNARIAIVIDGVLTRRDPLDRIAIGIDALLDVDVIERVEYAPGAAAANYGRAALTGLVNIVTRQVGREQTSSLRISANDRADKLAALTWTKLLDEGGWLTSASVQHQSNGLPVYENSIKNGEGVDTIRAFTKWQNGKFNFMAAGMSQRAEFREREIPSLITRSNLHIQAQWASIITPNWNYTSILSMGKVSERSRTGDIVQDDLKLIGESHWAHLTQKLNYLNWLGHQPEITLDYHWEPRASLVLSDNQGVLLDVNQKRHQLQFAIGNAITIAPIGILSLGLQCDLKIGETNPCSPRIGTIWSPASGWTAKMSTGYTFGPQSIADAMSPASESPVYRTEELAVEHSTTSNRLQLSIYRFNNTQSNGGNRQSEDINIFQRYEPFRNFGLEINSEWQYHGWNTVTNIAWRHHLGANYSKSRDRITSVLASTPWFNNNLQLSASFRHKATTRIVTEEAYTFRDSNHQLNLQFAFKPRGQMGKLTIMARTARKSFQSTTYLAESVKPARSLTIEWQMPMP